MKEVVDVLSGFSIMLYTESDILMSQIRPTSGTCGKMIWATSWP